MKARLTNRGRVAATVLATATLLFAGTAGATASAQSPLAGFFGAPASTQTTPATTPTLGGGGLPGLGLFKALFALFGAVRAQVPAIAAPIVSQALTAGTITPAEAAQLTSWLSGQHAQPTTGAAATPSPTTKPSAGEIAVLRQVFAAVLAQLPAIAAPVLASEVENGDLTQAQADMITKLLGRLAGGATTGTGGSTPATAGLGGSAASGNLLASVESKLTAQVKKATKKHRHKKKATRVHRTA
jgi:hypothetical protein